MDIKANGELFNSLKLYNDGLQNNFGNKILDAPPLEKKVYPYTIFRTVRDVSKKGYNSCYGKVSSKGFKIDIYAQNKGSKYGKQEIAETIAENIDDFMSFVGLERTSYNPLLENEGTTLHIVLVYSGDLDEYRRRFI
jgi:hypothetical protein